MTSEDIDVTINDVSGPTPTRPTSLFEGLRRLALASLGATALSREDVEEFTNKLVARGEIAQHDAEQLFRELRSGGRGPALNQLEDRFEQRVEQLLNRLNIPSKRDIDDLSIKIAQLGARMEELRKKDGE